MLDRRAAEVRKIIFDSARRAQWKITNYRQTAYGISLITGHAPNDNVRNQRFMDLLQRSGIIVDIDVTNQRRFLVGGTPYLEITFRLKWQ
jgi:hypothetical protein